MRALIVLATLIVPASSIAQPAGRPVPPAQAPRAADFAPAAKLDCVVNRVQHAERIAPARPRRLDEMPAGQLYLSVVRDVGGCQEMVLASEERARTARPR
jgi:hypothetical protein